MVAVVLALAVLAGGSRGVGGPQPGGKDAPKPLPKELVTAWEKAGAKAGWIRAGKYGYPEFIPGQSGQHGDLPAFRFVSWKGGVSPQLPAPEVPFGLDLSYIQITDAGLKELAGLKQLQAMSVGATKITDAGLKELAGLKQLQTLFLYGAQITDAGLKELAGLKQLQSLALAGTKITEAGLK
jgi:hypothetical protein